jgi:hypothetical protein
MWPRLETATLISDVANWALVCSLGVGAVSTVLIVWMASVKESYWDVDRERSRENIAQLTAESDRLSAAAEEARSQIAQANAIAAKANLRAEELAKENLEIRTKIAGRRVDVAQHDILVAILSDTPNDFNIECMSDGESGLFASDLFKTLTDAGWTSKGNTFPLGEIWNGLFLFMPDDPAVKLLAHALAAAGIPFKFAVGQRDRPTIMVGAKPSAF